MLKRLISARETSLKPCPLASAAIALSLTLSTHVPLPCHATIEDCRGSPSCISTSSYQAPSQYMPPWIITPPPLGLSESNLKSSAFHHLRDQLIDDGADLRLKDEEGGRIEASLNGDDLVFEIRDEILLFRSERKEGEITPPFCLVPGCITGTSNRGRLEALRDKLGFTNLETDEDKVWNRFMLH